MSNEQKTIPIQCIPIPPEEDEIDFKELIKTILKYKTFIIIFTLLITILAGIYAFLKKPVYETKASIQIGYIYSNSNSNKLYLLDPIATKIYLENIYKKDAYEKIKFPTLNVNTQNRLNDIYNLNILAYDNKDAIKYLNTILKDLKNKENKKLNIIKKDLNKKINILKNANLRLQNELSTLNKKLKYTKDAQLYATILNNISTIQKEITQNQLNIADFQNKLSPSNVIHTHIIGKIQQSPYPIKPKKKLIVIVAFITSFILSIFLVFLIEFFRNFKEE